jgi:uncharacterized protein YxeA
MKRVLVLIMALMLTLISACSTNTSTPVADDKNVVQNGEKQEDKAQDSKKEEKINLFEEFENNLNKDFEFEKVIKAAEMIDANEGYGYKFNDGRKVEVYRFDDKDKLKDFLENGFKIEGFNITLKAAANKDNFVIINTCDNDENIDDIIKVFNK